MSIRRYSQGKTYQTRQENLRDVCRFFRKVRESENFTVVRALLFVQNVRSYVHFVHFINPSLKFMTLEVMAHRGETW